MDNLKENLQQMLYYFLKAEESYNIELSEAPGGAIIAVKRKGKYNYLHAERKQEGYVRSGITHNEEMIRALCRKKYVAASLAAVKTDIKILKRALDAWQDTEHDRIIDSLPKVYKTLPEEYFGPMRGLTPSSWATQPYRQSTYMPERRVHTTSRGLRVRSKSELLIAEKLYEHGIPFRYEQILTIDGIDYAPDFTLMRADGTLVYWEHCGLTSSRGYMRRHWQKLQAYAEAGITPWKNLIVTYDDENGLLDLRSVESEIINRKEIHI